MKLHYSINLNKNYTYRWIILINSAHLRDSVVNAGIQFFRGATTVWNVVGNEFVVRTVRKIRKSAKDDHKNQRGLPIDIEP